MNRWLIALMLPGCLLGCNANVKMPDIFARKELNEPEKPLAEDVRTMAATKVFIETDRNILGSYTIIVKFNRDAYTVYDVRMADERSFSGQPIVNEAAFQSGEMKISSMVSKYSRTASIPLLKYHVATIYWSKSSASGAPSPAKASIVDLYDPEGRRIDGRGILSPDMIEAPPAQPQ